ncbi:MAG: hypothetical protein HY960_15770 [Ignavibacteriae bacterium]|nr:hypothetical protein [Ignavibacteriota bacterium]
MSSTELKHYIHHQVETTEDEELLSYIKSLLDVPTQNIHPELILTAKQLARIDEAKEQLATGKSYSEEEANLVVQQWLEK